MKGEKKKKHDVPKSSVDILDQNVLSNATTKNRKRVRREVAGSTPNEFFAREETDENKKKLAKKLKIQKKKKSKKRQAATTVQYGEEIDEKSSFADFNLDERLLKAIGKIGWEKPTQVQQNLIPLIMEGKNVTARGRTGSGKTGAYMLPIIQKVVQLTSVSVNNNIAGPFALFITPSKELASQVFQLLQKLTSTFPFILSTNYAALDLSDEEVWLKERPDVLVSTPSRLLRALKKYPQLCDEVKHVVLDEADLLLSYGYENEMKEIRNLLPSCYQTVFTSATLTEDLGPLKGLFVCGPLVSLKLKEGQLPDTDQLSQYRLMCQNDEERFAVFLALIKLKLLVGKTIIFVRDTNRCYQLGLFLQAFKVRSCILNSLLPTSSRCHVIQEFNEGRYNYVIASDANDVLPSENAAVDHENSTNSFSKRSKRKMDKESGVSRGIDFHHVSNVVNFDFPKSTDSYVHRVGRTARGWNKGTALSFVSREESKYLETVKAEIEEQMGHEVIMPYEIRLSDFDSFVLRSREALAACTKSVIREARLAEIREEVLRSEKLECYFAKNPREKASLEHDKKFHVLALHNPAIADVPDYMVPPSLRGLKLGPEETEVKKSLSRKRRKMLESRVSRMKFKRKMKDPLQSFSL